MCSLIKINTWASHMCSHYVLIGVATMGDSTCEKCDEYYKDPRMLPCLHTFCLACLEKELGTQESRDTLHCPNCKEKVTLSPGEVSDLPRDLQKANEAKLARISDRVENANEQCEICGRDDASGKAVAFCIDCKEFLCTSCKERHGKREKTLSHRVVAVGERLSETNKASIQQHLQCPLHQSHLLEFYCKQCERLICSNCMVSERHSDHTKDCKLVDEFASKEMESLCARVDKVDETIGTLDGAIGKCKQTMKQVNVRKREVDAAINDSLEQVRKTLLAQNKEIQTHKVKHLEKQTRDLQRVHDSLHHLSCMIKDAESHSPIQQLSSKKTLADRAVVLQKKFEDSDLVPCQCDTFNTDIALSDVIKQMIYLGSIGGSRVASTTCDAGYVPCVVIGKPRTIRVVAKTRDGKPYGHGGERVEAKLVLKDFPELAIQGETTDHGDSSYSVSLTAQSHGEHEVHVTIGGGHITGSPFSWTAVNPRNSYTSLSAQQCISTKSDPVDVGVTKEGFLTVAQLGSHTVTLYTKEGEALRSFGVDGVAGSADEQFSHPSALAVKGDILYVTDEGNSRVQKLSISGRCFISRFGTAGQGYGQFSNPHGIAIDPEGKVFVADSNNSRIQVFRDDDSFSHSFTCEKQPWRLAFDQKGHLHVIFNGCNSVHFYTPEEKNSLARAMKLPPTQWALPLMLKGILLYVIVLEAFSSITQTTPPFKHSQSSSPMEWEWCTITKTLSG